MATLTGATIASTYLGVLNVTGAVGADTVEAVTDGAGTSTSLSLSQQRATITLGSGAADDFIVDGTTLVVEGDTNMVGIGTADPEALLHLKSTLDTAAGGLLIETTDADNDDRAPEVSLFRNGDVSDVSTAVGDGRLAAIRFKGLEATSGDTITYASICGQAYDATNTTCDGMIVIETIQAGTVATVVTIDRDKVGIGAQYGDTSPTLRGHLDVRGTEAAPAIIAITSPNQAITNTENLGTIEWWANENDAGEAQEQAAVIQYIATDDWNDTVSPANLEFKLKASADVSPTTMMAIGHNGHVGIGTTTPSEEFEIENTGDPNMVAHVKATALTNTDFAVWRVRGTGNSVENIADFGVAYYSATANNKANKPTSYIRLQASDENINYYYVADDDKLMRSGTKSIIGQDDGSAASIVGEEAASDERLKNISSDAFPYGLTEVNQLVPIKFSWKRDSNNKSKLGFGAQTTEVIIPEAVKNTGECIDGYDYSEDENGGDIMTPKSSEMGLRYMTYDSIIPVLVKAVQELSAKVTALENA